MLVRRLSALVSGSLVVLGMLAAPVAHAADDAAARKVLQQVADRNSAGFQTGQSKTRITLTLADGRSKSWLTLARVARKDNKLRTRVTSSIGVSNLVRAKKSPVSRSEYCSCSRTFASTSNRAPLTAWMIPGPSGQVMVRMYAGMGRQG